MFKWVIVAFHINDKNIPVIYLYGPYSKREAEKLSSIKDFTQPGFQLGSVNVIDLNSAGKLERKK